MLRNKSENYFTEPFSPFSRQWEAANETGPDGFSFQMEEAKVS